MACNFLVPRAPNIRGSDETSEGSESGTATSGWTSNWDSREDLRDYVTRMGFKDVSDLFQDRFRVDRKKLEHLLSGDNEAPLPADVFFEQIMADTDTFITWPSKLKIGAKSKKDPHVRIAGKPDDVLTAKERIVRFLDTKSNRVTMKIDLSYTDHSHIIGKGGMSVKRVMEETKCHVHFPDSNRSNSTEKSNQVSIAGEIQGVEMARSRVRQKAPVLFGFELPIMAQSVDPNSLYIMKLQDQYNVQVMLKTRPKLHATLVLVKGAEWEVEQVKKATMLLVEHICDSLSHQILIQMSMDISPHHHPMVIGKNHSNLRDIIRVTGAQIMFPDAQDPNIPSLKKSHVTITGNIHNVYLARQLLIGSLPLLLMFELPLNQSGLAITPDNLAEIQEKCDVTINLRSKAKQNIMACIIKGQERFASNIYKARNMVLGIDDPSIIADIPSSYHMPNVPLNLQPLELTVPPITPQPMYSPPFSPVWPYPNRPYTRNAPFMMQHPFMYNSMQSNSMHSAGSSGYQSLGQLSLNSHEQSRENSSYSTISSVSSTSSPNASLMNTCPNYHPHRSMEQQEKIELSSVLNEMNVPGGYHGPTVDKRQESCCLQNPNDYDQKRIAGFKAMQSRPTGLRYPNNVWSGYGLSHTSPAIAIPDSNQNNGGNAAKEEEDWKTPTTNQTFDFSSPAISLASTLNTSNYLDHTPSAVLNRMTSSKWPDMITLLTSLGLEKYIRLFVAHEIDLATFVSMSDKDLLDVGVTAFGARRKMLCAIAEMKSRANLFSPAPGAERKSSSSSPCSDKWAN